MKEKLLEIVCQSGSDYNILNELYNYIEKIEIEKEQLKKQLNYLKKGEYFNQLRFERDVLKDLVDKGEVSKENKEFIDCTHRNTELLEENKQLKEQLEKERKARKCAIEYINENSNIYLNIMGNKVGFFINHNDGWTPIELLDILNIDKGE